jgi:mono/diheme cytochrome c family protein
MKNKTCTAQFLKIISIVLLFLIGQNLSQAQSGQWKVPESAKKVKNPLANNATEIRKGSILFKTNCAPCHGVDGKGDGPSSATIKPPPPNLTNPWKPEDTDGALYYIISEGHNKPMPTWKKVLNNTQMWELVKYIRTLPDKHK